MAAAEGRSMNALAETLTQAEARAYDAFPLWCTNLWLVEPHTLVKLLLPGSVVVEGWVSRNFLGGKPTFWTWDERFARISQVQPTFPGEAVSVLARLVEPMAWAPLAGEAGAVAPKAWAIEAPKEKAT